MDIAGDTDGVRRPNSGKLFRPPDNSTDDGSDDGSDVGSKADG